MSGGGEHRDPGEHRDHDLAQVDGILARMRAGGGRATTARRALVQLLVRSRHSHISAEDLVASIQAELPDVAESTVYRSLSTLEDLGVVEHAHLGHGPSTYHLVGDVHQHLVCQHCGRVLEVPDSELADLADQLDRSYGFQMQPHHFAIAGLCRDCRSDT